MQALMEPSFNIENFLKKYLPTLFFLIDPKSINWDSIKKTYIKKFELYTERFYRIKSSFRTEASIYSIIISSEEKDPTALRLLDYINSLFSELKELLDDSEKGLIKDNIIGLLSNIDMKYLNFLGELSVLHFLKRRFSLKLTATEFPIDSATKKGSKIDFKFLNTETSSEELIEIVNIHISEKNINTQAKIENLLSQKIGEKLAKKRLRERTNVYLFPVIWGQWDEVKSIISYYSQFRPEFKNTSIPLCFIPFIDQNGNLVHMFGTIDKILENN